MNATALPYITCPYCHSDLRIYRIFGGNKKHIRYGLVTCSCDTYPILESILILKKPVNREVLDDVIRGRYDAACNKLFSLQRGYNHFLRFTNPLSLASRIIERVTHRTIFSFLGFQGVLYPLTFIPRSRAWASNLINLPHMTESKIPSTLLSLMKSKPTCVVDVGCGITPYATQKTLQNLPTLIGIDKEFALLYITSVFFHNPLQSLICADLTHGFPLKDNVADLIYSMDCITFLYNQISTVSSMLKSTIQNGIVWFDNFNISGETVKKYEFPRKPIFYEKHVPNPYRIFDYATFLKAIKSNGGIFNHKKQHIGTRYGILIYRRAITK